MVTMRWETPTISGSRVPMTTSLNNPALALPPFTSPQLNTDVGILMPTSSMALGYRSGSLSSFGCALKTIPRPQVPSRGQKIYRATS